MASQLNCRLSSSKVLVLNAGRASVKCSLTRFIRSQPQTKVSHGRSVLLEPLQYVLYIVGTGEILDLDPRYLGTEGFDEVVDDSVRRLTHQRNVSQLL
ncbi:unnamed protein product [Phytophthora lilii]|uniref:Unnamed protein product n=1 Tax=Phytophthora lilii TaxID=2077276 RepID=A0A9W6YGV2_9STRA|nr:unnamed protein product [Phytophthora lilii]